jgi:KipI family sensor histidine kinase inhibitor
MPGGPSPLRKAIAVVPLGDLAAYVEYSRTLDLEVNELVQRIAAAVRALGEPRVRDVVAGLGGLALHFVPTLAESPVTLAEALVARCVKHGLPEAGQVGRHVEIPVCYEPEFALDLEDVCEKTRLGKDEVRELHLAGEYRVLMIGFAPGHAYLGGLDPKLSVPRRATPRALVPAGSVAIANQQSVVYPYAIPGGWSVIGRTPLKVFDALRAQPSLFGNGDRVHFRAVGKQEFLRIASSP